MAAAEQGGLYVDAYSTIAGGATFSHELVHLRTCCLADLDIKYRLPFSLATTQSWYPDITYELHHCSHHITMFI